MSLSFGEISVGNLQGDVENEIIEHKGKDGNR